MLAGMLRLRKGWRIQTRVIGALMIRELHTRFGRENIGFLWVMVEPLLFAGMVATIWRFIDGPIEHGVNIVAFLVSGYLPITLFRHAVMRSLAIFVANGSLLYHRQIQILDFVFVRFLIEMIGCMMAYVFIGSILVYFEVFPVPANIGALIGGWLMYSLFSLSICVIIAPLSTISEVLEKVIPVLTYIMLPFSGLFTMIAWLAPRMRAFLLWSPFANCMEIMRMGIWGDKLKVYYSVWYPLACSLVAMAIGLLLCRYVRKTMTVE